MSMNCRCRQIADEVHQATQRLAELSRSPQLANSLQNLNRSLDNVRGITAEARRQLLPLLDKVRQAAAQAEGAVRSARTVLGSGAAANNSAQTAELPRALYELTNAARSLRELADYLDRHPKALIEGRRG